MQHARGHRYGLPCPNHDLAILKLDYQLTLDAVERLVGSRMTVPANCWVITLMRIS